MQKHFNKAWLCVLALLLTVVLAVGLVACNRTKNNTTHTGDYTPGESIVDSKDVEIEQGTNGTSEKWTEKDITVKYLLDNGSYLTLSGSKYDELKISGYRGEIENISLKDIEDNVKVDGNAISVTGIANSAFRGVDTLKNVDLTKSHQSLEFEIGSYAFYGCTSLRSVQLPSQLYVSDNVIGTSAFENCSSLEAININDKFTSVGSSAFKSCTSLEEVSLPSKMKTIQASTFENCSSLTGIELPTNLRAIGSSAFNNSGISSIDFSDCESLHAIGQNAFAYTALSSVTIPSSVTTLGTMAFFGLRDLSSVTLPFLGTTVAQQQSNTWSFATTFGYMPTYTDDEDFHRYIDVTVTGTANIPSGAFQGSNDLRSVSLNFTSEDRVPVYGYDGDSYELDDLDLSTDIPDRAFSGCSSLESFTLPNNTQAIGESAFYNCENLNSIALPSELVSIGNNAFEGCTSLTTFTLPASVTELGTSILKNCISLRTLTIEGYHKSGIDYSYAEGSLYENLFNSTSTIASRLFSSSYNSSYIDSMYQCYTASSSYVYVPNTLNSITVKNVYNAHENFLRGLRSLTSVEIEYADFEDLFSDEYLEYLREEYDDYYGYYSEYESFEDFLEENFYDHTIGSYAFSGLENCTTLPLPEKVTSIGNYAFNGCTHLNEISLPTGLLSIGQNAFYDCENLGTLTLPAGLLAIGQNAFGNCYSLTSLTIPSSVTSISTPIFYDNTSLQNLTIEDYDKAVELEETSYPDYTYYEYRYFGVKTLFAPSSEYDSTWDDEMEQIDSHWFPTSLKNITLKSVTYLNSDEFSGFDLSGLTITVELTSDLNVSNDGSYYSHEDVEKETTIASGAFQNATCNIEIKNLSYLKNIGSNAFNGANYTPTFTSLTSLESIGSMAFANNDEITDVTIPASVTSFTYTSLFANCSSLSKLVFEDWATCMSSNNLHVLFGTSYPNDNYNYYTASPSSYGSSSYYIPSTLKTVEAHRVSSIPNGMFRNLRVETIVITGRDYYGDEDDTAIFEIGSGSSNQPFYGCSALTKIPECVHISYNANGSLYNCNSLKELSVYLPYSSSSTTSNYYLGSLFSSSSSSNSYLPYSLKTVHLETQEDYSYSYIPRNFLYNASDVTTVTLPETGLSGIGESAFTYCGVLNGSSVEDNDYVVSLDGWVIAASTYNSSRTYVLPADTKGIANGVITTPSSSSYRTYIYFEGETDEAYDAILGLSSLHNAGYVYEYIFSDTDPDYEYDKNTSYDGFWHWDTYNSTPQVW